MSYYKTVRNTNLVNLFRDELTQGLCVINKEGKLEFNQGFFWDSPWIHTEIPKKLCGFHTQFTVNKFSFIPLECLTCYKVVVRPRTVHELMALALIQQDFSRSKCGMELRPEVPALYGGYFYTSSLEEGKERYKEVRERVDHISPDIPVFLKRACTEYEFKYGDSKEWTEIPDQKKIEEALFGNIVLTGPGLEFEYQPEVVKEFIRMKWIEYAHENGDMSYLPYNDGNPLTPKYSTYEEEEVIIHAK